MCLWRIRLGSNSDPIGRAFKLNLVTRPAVSLQPNLVRLMIDERLMSDAVSSPVAQSWALCSQPTMKTLSLF